MTTTPKGAFDVIGFDAFQAAVEHNTDAAYEQMRDTTPVYQLPGQNVFLITRYNDIVAAAHDIETFSNEFKSPGLALGAGSSQIAEELEAIRATGYPQVSTMLTRDPPAHTRYRRLVGRAFTARRVESWKPVIERVTRELTDQFADAGQAEIVSAFAVPLPVRVIADALGVPRERERDFKQWTDDATLAIGANPSDEGRLAAARGLAAFQHYFAEQLESRRLNPRDDFLTDLVQAAVALDDELDDKKPLDTPEMLNILHQLLVAGNETTTSLIASTLILLVDMPFLQDLLRGEPAAAKDVVDEALRLTSPAQGMFRVVRRDVTVAGVEIPAGATAILMYASGNRDATRYECPNEFRVDRGARQHLAFGQGLHYCVGASLSRAEAEFALTHLCQRLSDIHIVGQPTYKPSFVLSGPRTLQLAYSARPVSTLNQESV